MLHDDTYYFNIIRANIKKEREKKGLTQQQLADKAGITMNYLAKIESQKMGRGFTIKKRINLFSRLILYF